MLFSSHNLNFREGIVTLLHLQAFTWSLTGTLGIAKVQVIINLVIGIFIMEIHTAVMPSLCQPEFITLCTLFSLWGWCYLS